METRAGKSPSATAMLVAQPPRGVNPGNLKSIGMERKIYCPHRAQSRRPVAPLRFSAILGLISRPEICCRARGDSRRARLTLHGSLKRPYKLPSLQGCFRDLGRASVM
jgi:hypothetical protein